MDNHYFLTTYGSAGQISYAQDELKPFKEVIHLSGFPREIVSALIKEYGVAAKQNGIRSDYIHNALNGSFEGILFPKLNTGIVNCPIYEMRYDVEAIFKHEENFNRLSAHFKKLTEIFKKAKLVHDEWEKVYISATDYNALNQYTEDVASKLLSDRKTDAPGCFKDRFFGAATINGPVDYILNLTEACKRYFIKGRPGTGKSSFLKKLANSAKERGFTVERYHCAFDPQSLDMIIIKELNLSLFDATSPHEHAPERENDEILDLFKVAVNPQTDQRFQKEIKELSGRYKALMNQGTKTMIQINEICKAEEAKLEAKISKDALMELKANISDRVFSK